MPSLKFWLAFSGVPAKLRRMTGPSEYRPSA